MATQYTAGITQGQAWTAAIANQIGAAWETWTPTYFPTTGTFTTVTTNTARYCRIQTLVTAQLDVSITSIGTAGGLLSFLMPVAAKTTTAMSCGNWREIAVYGYSGIVSIDASTTASLRRYDNASYLAAGQRFTLTMTYEAA